MSVIKPMQETRARWSVNDWVKLLLVLTACLGFLGVVWMAIQRLVEPMVVVTFVFTTLSGIIAALGLNYTNRANEQGRAEAFNLGKQEQVNEYRLAALRTQPK
jgi:uncharacterized protein involved in cysteine biosynthesis